MQPSDRGLINGASIATFDGHLEYLSKSGFDTGFNPKDEPTGRRVMWSPIDTQGVNLISPMRPLIFLAHV